MQELIDIIKSEDNKTRLQKVQSAFHEYLKENLNHDNAILSFPVINQLLFLYDSIYFNKYLVKNSVIALDISRRMTRAAGLTKFNKKTKHFEIVFSVPLLLHAFKENEGRAFEVNGLLCNTPSEALMRVMEHELVHVLEFILKGNSSCSKRDFRVISYNLFGHTQTKHAISNEPISTVKKSDYKIGQTVSFEYDGHLYTGIINRITKRATVLVKSPKGIYKDEAGIRYAKYYVPLTLLKKIV